MLTNVNSRRDIELPRSTEDSMFNRQSSMGRPCRVRSHVSITSVISANFAHSSISEFESNAACSRENKPKNLEMCESTEPVNRNIHILMNPVLQECPSRFQGAPVLPEASKRIECTHLDLDRKSVYCHPAYGFLLPAV